jgi:hypothetical protein
MNDASGAVTGAHGPVNGVAAVYRPAPAYRRPYLARFVKYLLVTAALMVISTVASIGYVLGSITAIVAVYYGVAYAWRGRFQTIVTPAGIEIRRYRNQTVPWSAVRAIEVGGYGAASLRRPAVSRRGRPASPVWGSMSGAPAQLATVTVVRPDNKRILLPAPLVTAWASDPSFTDKARELQRLCELYAGPVELRSTRPHS